MKYYKMRCYYVDSRRSTTHVIRAENKKSAIKIVNEQDVRYKEFGEREYFNIKELDMKYTDNKDLIERLKLEIGGIIWK